MSFILGLKGDKFARYCQLKNKLGDTAFYTSDKNSDCNPKVRFNNVTFWHTTVWCSARQILVILLCVATIPLYLVKIAKLQLCAIMPKQGKVSVFSP